MSESTEIDQLLKIIGEDSKESKPIFYSKLGEFISEFNIEKGFDRVPNYVLWYTYKAVFKGTMSKIAFFRAFKPDFEQRRTGKQRVYMLNKNSFDLTHEGVTRAEFFNKEK
jgi:hypothetical protein|tara:strand:- start:1550 stop:1882 length:333 start_codon:yes stop_codon:yes gene_type:complete